MHKITRRLLLAVLGCEAMFFLMIGFRMSPTAGGNWVACAWVSVANLMCLLLSFGMLWSELFAESWNEAMGEKPNPKLSPKQVRVECAKIIVYPTMIAINVAVMLLAQK